MRTFRNFSLLMTLAFLLSCRHNPSDLPFEALPTHILFYSGKPTLLELQNRSVLPLGAGLEAATNSLIMSHIIKDHTTQLSGLSSKREALRFFDAENSNKLAEFLEDILKGQNLSDSVSFSLQKDLLWLEDHYSLKFKSRTFSHPVLYKQRTIPYHAAKNLHKTINWYPNLDLFPEESFQDTITYYTYEVKDLAYHLELSYRKFGRIEKQHLIIPTLEEPSYFTTPFLWNEPNELVGQ
ncbi:hypothetical protein [Pontibacter sp. G13]|uniref:hypothetical protein n=1 Tax=Pontibacter sp. G13 TaxID=3074898 RepID=UPI00288A83B1|nr:hypothetical protein [Pontibacter sp. G13]WNJ17023.1 hypothetical protein RJD25_19385 [Pontibacter sp. G13]